MYISISISISSFLFSSIFYIYIYIYILYSIYILLKRTIRRKNLGATLPSPVAALPCDRLGRQIENDPNPCVRRPRPPRNPPKSAHSSRPHPRPRPRCVSLSGSGSPPTLLPCECGRLPRHPTSGRAASRPVPAHPSDPVSSAPCARCAALSPPLSLLAP